MSGSELVEPPRTNEEPADDFAFDDEEQEATPLDAPVDENADETGEAKAVSEAPPSSQIVGGSPSAEELTQTATEEVVQLRTAELTLAEESQQSAEDPEKEALQQQAITSQKRVTDNDFEDNELDQSSGGLFAQKFEDPSEAPAEQTPPETSTAGLPDNRQKSKEFRVHHKARAQSLPKKRPVKLPPIKSPKPRPPFDLTGIITYHLTDYDGLKDKNLQLHFASDVRRRHLKRMGLITEDEYIVPKANGLLKDITMIVQNSNRSPVKLQMQKLTPLNAVPQSPYDQDIGITAHIRHHPFLSKNTR